MKKVVKFFLLLGKKYECRTVKFSQEVYYTLKELQTLFIRWLQCDVTFSLFNSCFYRVGFAQKTSGCMPCEK